MPLPKKNTQGFLIIEVLLATVIFTSVIITLFSMVSFLARRGAMSRYDAEASNLLQEVVEISYSSIKTDWDSYPNGEYYPVYDSVW